LAAHDGELAATLAGMLATPSFRLYSSSDVRGVEIGGAAKTFLRLQAGSPQAAASGERRGRPHRTRFAELSRFGRAHGALPGTLAGLSGLAIWCSPALRRCHGITPLVSRWGGGCLSWTP